MLSRGQTLYATLKTASWQYFTYFHPINIYQIKRSCVPKNKCNLQNCLIRCNFLNFEQLLAGPELELRRMYLPFKVKCRIYRGGRPTLPPSEKGGDFADERPCAIP